MHAFANASNTLAVLQPASPTLAASLAHQTLSCVPTPVIDLLVSLVLSAPRLEELCVGLPPSTLEWTCDGALVQLLVDAWQRRASAAEGDAPVYVSWEEHEAGVLRLASSAETHPLRSGPTEHVEPVFVRANEEEQHAEKVGAHLPQPFFAVDMVRDEVDRPALGQGLPVALPAVPERRGRVRHSFIDDRGIDIERSPERDSKESSIESLDRVESMEEDHASPQGPRSALAADRGTQPSQLFQ
ncbi:hypothetical protein H632_c277p0 [Helicosporidium sp. ATCC 50920]|nr:hypothetical protein H632_c277p0 [Helicosporidium sp. ATCC 50920]|eukprot:KDD76301.1 hypothetical protein H632_c277p0 [Helicosporidium sp. ATCC 50920]